MSRRTKNDRSRSKSPTPIRKYIEQQDVTNNHNHANPELLNMINKQWEDRLKRELEFKD